MKHLTLRSYGHSPFAHIGVLPPPPRHGRGGAVAVTEAKLVPNYYSKTCPRAEPIVTDMVSQRQLSHPTTAAGVLRIFFHDCFVSGRDASLLVSTTAFACPLRARRRAEPVVPGTTPSRP
ncbi:hypothetical protein BAE44_0007503 [Dichanthelium oligosanthes]|uniref:Plant heme peroxidase family profile domain-containing protein n=1 Tax=Dichanthelium oligosanthes TaxID=888268 RepID=A0A1E5W233_9POAL|nr:hypothetical protein BAE44_0007503 [Dichanthelium oligosanthes]